MTSYWHALAGGGLIGLSAVLLLLVNGRIAGISGIAGRLLQGKQVWLNAAFILGLISGPVFYSAVFGTYPSATVVASGPVMALAGVFVGFGTRMGSGCTSGHGILGMARFSRRSIAATAIFLLSGILVATISGLFQ
ncbi:YeeE/YedE family protein [Mesorhizobium sp. BAC0120]|uniref:YeeE/YedE family protein n=1 Tax=Mesorhizobium sp. BAC0120 TaxID=3090670 RepID=UPI00298BD311|nr:YeeE/YedE family protein [Mesorhizobium sp. BAC0120]MDW6022533.1 YeeE/YedE family protein [Mesorhizobium sp. BAC0120]